MYIYIYIYIYDCSSNSAMQAAKAHLQVCCEYRVCECYRDEDFGGFVADWIGNILFMARQKRIASVAVVVVVSIMSNLMKCGPPLEEGSIYQ